jgi:hypothetical protein
MEIKLERYSDNLFSEYRVYEHAAQIYPSFIFLIHDT